MDVAFSLLWLVIVFAIVTGLRQNARRGGDSEDLLKVVLTAQSQGDVVSEPGLQTPEAMEAAVWVRAAFPALDAATRAGDVGPIAPFVLDMRLAAFRQRISASSWWRDWPPPTLDDVRVLAAHTGRDSAMFDARLDYHFTSADGKRTARYQETWTIARTRLSAPCSRCGATAAPGQRTCAYCGAELRAGYQFRVADVSSCRLVQG